VQARVRRLSTEEQRMWDRVAATIRPLSRELESSLERGGELSAERMVEGGRSPPPRALRQPLTPLPPPRSGEEHNHSRNTLDSSWDKRLRSGKAEPDRVLDLHGKTLDQAWSAIDRALERAIAADERILLLITGHARSGDPPLQRGKIRSAVNDWLRVSRHAPRIAAVRGAHPRHGGGGSLYIVLRRNRPVSTFS
jgi:DNA-nicking Smr family endonuclease